MRANKLVALFHNLRLLTRAKKPNYTEPAVGWNEEDDKVGVTAFGVSHYESTAKLHVKAPPVRPPVEFLLGAEPPDEDERLLLCSYV